MGQGCLLCNWKGRRGGGRIGARDDRSRDIPIMID